MRSFLSLLFFTLSVSVTVAQAGRDEVLAKSYLQNGEFEKATELYQDLWEKNSYDNKFYAPLYKCLITLKKFDDLEKVVKKQVKKFDGVAQYVVDLGYLYAQIPDPNKSKEQYDKALKELKPNEIAIRNLAAAFETYRLYDYVIAVYDKGNKVLPGGSYFSLELADAYNHKGDIPNSIKQYMAYMELRPEGIQQVKNIIQTSANEQKLLDELETQLYAKVQKAPGNEDYIDLLTWVYIQNKDFEGALVQMKALDKRKNENGFRVLNIARMAQTEAYYSDAIAGYEYIVSKGKENSLYFQARTELLNCRKEKISKNINYTQEDLIGLKSDYLSFIDDNGRGFTCMILKVLLSYVTRLLLCPGLIRS
jgi:tetratricopeptide (TPR) repeat protein